MSCQLGYMVQGWTLVTLGTFHAGPGQDGGGGFMHVSVSASGDAPVQLPGATTYNQSSNDYGVVITQDTGEHELNCKIEPICIEQE